MSQTPFFGVMSNQDGTYTDLFSGQTISDSDIKVRNMAPFYGRFIDKDGVEHDLRDISGGGSDGTVMWFDTISARDLYFTQHPTALKKGISVGVGNPVTAYTFNDTWITGALAFRGADGKDGKDGKIGPTGQAATIEVGAVTTGEPGTDAVVENVGTDTAAVLNITIPRGADGGGGSLPWCTGYFEDRSIKANTHTLLKPVQDGGDELLLGNTIVAPDDGFYLFNTYGGRWPVSTTTSTRTVQINSTDILETENMLVNVAMRVSSPDVMVISVALKMAKGDYLSNFIYSAADQTSLSADGRKLRFAFIQLSKDGDV